MSEVFEDSKDVSGIEHKKLRKSDSGSDIKYTVSDSPPWHLSLLLGFQHYISMYVVGLSVPLIVSNAVCMGEDNVAKSQLISAMFFSCGFSTLMQVFIGSRLPIVQISTVALLSPTLAYLNLPQFECPVIVKDVNSSINGSVVLGSPEHVAAYTERLNVVNGSIMVASLVEVFLGLTGVIGFLLRYIGPLCIAPTISLIGLSLFRTAAEYSAHQWGIAMTVVILITVFSQYLDFLQIPCLSCKVEKKCKCKTSKYPLFQMFPVILALLLGWLLCYIFTVTDVFPNDPDKWGYGARTDIRSSVLTETPWISVPYPGQWGLPTVSAAMVVGLIAGIFASVVESVGDYHTCARVSGAPHPPQHAINRGIMMEGMGCLIAGAFGAGNGVTSNSANIGIIGLTKVGSRSVITYTGFIMIVLAVFNKFGALFTMMPDPVLGGSFLVLFALIFAVGISNLHLVDLSSSRNLFIFGFAFFFGLAFPEWIKENPDAINTGNEIADSIITVLLSTNMFVGGVIAFILDNTVRGTKEERGMASVPEPAAAAWDDGDSDTNKDVYDIPFISRWTDKIRFCSYIPIMPKSNKLKVEPDDDSEFA